MSSNPATRSPSTRPCRTGCTTWAISPSTRSGSSTAGDQSMPGRRPASRSRTPTPICLDGPFITTAHSPPDIHYRTSRCEEALMHSVGHVDWSFTASPQPSSATSHLLARQVLVGREHGAVHTELAVGALQPGGWLGRHIHSFEEALYVLEGELLMELDGRVYRLQPGD